MPLFLAFLLVPLIEIALFIQLGGMLGLWPTLAIVVATAALGAALVRSQGQAQIQRLQRGEDPAGTIGHAAGILAAGALLLTPGFFTDAVGFLLLVPGIRRRIGARIQARMAARTVIIEGEVLDER